MLELLGKLMESVGFTGIRTAFSFTFPLIPTVFLTLTGAAKITPVVAPWDWGDSRSAKNNPICTVLVREINVIEFIIVAKGPRIRLGYRAWPGKQPSFDERDPCAASS